METNEPIATFGRFRSMKEMLSFANTTNGLLEAVREPSDNVLVRHVSDGGLPTLGVVVDLMPEAVYSEIASDRGWPSLGTLPRSTEA